MKPINVDEVKKLTEEDMKRLVDAFTRSSKSFTSGKNDKRPNKNDEKK